MIAQIQKTCVHLCRYGEIRTTYSCSGSALPTTRHFPTSQVVNLRDKLYDRLWRRRTVAIPKVTSQILAFEPYLHLPPARRPLFRAAGTDIPRLIVLGRTADLHIHSPKGLEELLTPMLAFFNHQMTYKIFFHAFETKEAALIYEDRSLTVTTIPLRHRMPCCGFLFAEKPRPNHILRDMIDFYQVPVYELNRIKNGADYVTPEGEVIPNARLTRPSAAPRRYAYCSDTIYLPSITEQIKGVDLLFHEATFAQTEQARAKETYHTTAAQAAQLALDANVRQLVIGHFSARYEDESVLLHEASAIFPQTILAKENLCIDVDGGTVYEK
mgnify:CR=1 FL=1